jgi:hypothetical protein
LGDAGSEGGGRDHRYLRLDGVKFIVIDRIAGTRCLRG